MKQARSFKWVCCLKCGASIVQGKPCPLCRDIARARALGGWRSCAGARNMTNGKPCAICGHHSHTR